MGSALPAEVVGWLRTDHPRLRGQLVTENDGQLRTTATLTKDVPVHPTVPNQKVNSVKHILVMTGRHVAAQQIHYPSGSVHLMLYKSIGSHNVQVTLQRHEIQVVGELAE